MTELESAISELMAWSLGKGAPPKTSVSLIDVIAAGAADFGVAIAPLHKEPDGAWIADYFGALATISSLDPQQWTSSRNRKALSLAKEHTAYHISHLLQRYRDFDLIGAAWDCEDDQALCLSFAEVTAHLAHGFANHGRAPHCGPSGRRLLPGVANHDGPGVYIPPRPPYRFAGDNVAEVETHFGLPIFVDTRDDSVCPDIVRTGWWEPWIEWVIRRCVGPGDVAINVGANVGFHTLLLTSLAGPRGCVYAFEPQPELVDLLIRSLTWGGLLATTTVLPFAASNQRGVTEFSISKKKLGAGNMVRSRIGGLAECESFRQLYFDRFRNFASEEFDACIAALEGASETFSVPTTLIDATIGRAVEEAHFLLIDAEGAEPLVFEGARELIHRSRDIAIVFEWQNGADFARTAERKMKADEIVSWLVSESFKFWKIEGDRRDVFSQPAILTPISPAEILSLSGYADLYAYRHTPSFSCENLKK